MLKAVTGKGSGWLVCISASPRFMRTSALAALKEAQKALKGQRRGCWVMSSWGCISLFSVGKTTGLAWLLQCKCWAASGVNQAHSRHTLTHTKGTPAQGSRWWNCLLLCKVLFSVKSKGFHLNGADMNGYLSLGSRRCIITRKNPESSLNHKWKEPNSNWLQGKRLIGRTLGIWDAGTRVNPKIGDWIQEIRSHQAHSFSPLFFPFFHLW